MRNFIFVFLFIFCSREACSIRKYQGSIDPVQIFISKKQFCRLYVEGDRIQKIIGSTDSIAVESDEDSGHLWIKSQDATKDPILVTLITEKGYIQDLKILVSEKLAETAAIIPFQKRDKNESKSYREEAISLIRAIIKKEDLEGYIPSKAAANRNEFHGFVFKPIGSYKGRRLIANHYQIRNTLKHSQIIREHSFCRSNEIAVTALMVQLEPEEVTSLIIVERINSEKDS